MDNSWMDDFTCSGFDIVYKYVRGSRLYGLETENSDTDYTSVYLESYKDLLGLRYKYVEQINNNGNDDVSYSMDRFFTLLLKSNPNMIEALFVPDDKIIIKKAKIFLDRPYDVLNHLFENKDKFLTKKLATILTQYSHSQIRKAKGLNKAIERPVEERKTPLDFCYTFNNQGSKSFKSFLDEKGMKQEYCGLVNINNMRDMYAVFYDWGMHYKNDINITYQDKSNNPREWKVDYNDTKYEEIEKILKTYADYEYISMVSVSHEMSKIEPIGYKGIIMDDSTELRLSSVEKHVKPICYIHYNKDGYSTHCKDYKSYQDWKKNRNPERYKINVTSNRNYDVKNMSQCIRLLTMGEELVRGEGFILDRRNIDRDLLLSIKLGEWEYEKVLELAETKKSFIENNIDNSPLEDTIDEDFVNYLLFKSRMVYFNHNYQLKLMKDLSDLEYLTKQKTNF